MFFAAKPLLLVADVVLIVGMQASRVSSLGKLDVGEAKESGVSHDLESIKIMQDKGENVPHDVFFVPSWANAFPAFGSLNGQR